MSKGRTSLTNENAGHSQGIRNPHWWQWASGWASGEDNGQNKKELSYSWDWKAHSRRKALISSFQPWKDWLTAPSLLHPLHLGTFIRVDASPGKSVVQWGEQEPWSQMEWAPSSLFLCPAPWPWAAPPWNGGDSACLLNLLWGRKLVVNASLRKQLKKKGAGRGG